MEDKIILTKEEALKIADIQEDKIHNFFTASFGLVGADYELETFNEYLDSADYIEVGGNNCRGMDHALVIWKKGTPYFFQHKEDKLKELLKEKGIED